MKIEPEAEDFDPDQFDTGDALAAFAAGIAAFNGDSYHAAHEEFERCWLANEAGDADFYKGLVQVCICMHHLVRDNPDGAKKLYTGHRRLLGAYLPEHGGLDVAALLADMQRTLGPVLRGKDRDPNLVPRMVLLDK